MTGTAGDAAPRGGATHWVAGAVLATLSIAVHVARFRGEILHGIADESLLVPLAHRSVDAALYAGDSWLDVCAGVYSHAYSAIVAACLRFTDDPVVAMRVLGAPFLVVFLAGCFRIVDRAAGRAAAWGGTAVVASLPPLFTWGWANAGSAVPLAAGAGLPRDLVFALIPWLWIARGAAQGRFARCAVYGALGLLVNLHPLTAIHVIGAFAVTDLIVARTWRAVADLALCGVAAAVFATPYFIQYAHFPRTPGSAPLEIVRWRVEAVGAETASGWMHRLEPGLWTLAAVVLLRRASRGSRADGAPDVLAPLVRLTWVAVGLAALSPLAQNVVPGLQFGRLVRVAVWSGALVVAGTLPAAFAASRARAAAALLCAAVAVAGPVTMRAATNALRGPVEYVVRRIEVRVVGAESETTSPVPRRASSGDPSLDASRGASFLAVCEFARTHTAPGDRFLVPPEDFGAFRAYALRGVVATRKEGSTMLSFLGGQGALWFDDYVAILTTYREGGPEEWGALARRFGTRWAVLDAAAPAPPAWREAFTHGPYRVLRTSIE
jgi:hypothetical protein